MTTNALAYLPLVVLFITGCQTTMPIYTIERVDLHRFMGDWYVVANIPTFIEKEAHNAIETYELQKDGTIATTFKFNKGSLDGPLKTYSPKGFIRDKETNAVWDMQFLWPFKAEYRIVYLNENYTQTVIGRSKRDYVWIMSRSPSIPEADYDRILDFLADQGYDITKIQKVPHDPK